MAAWRHIVTVFRAQGAHNVIWLWTINADQTGTGAVASWWPGANYVTWVGIDGYYYPPADTFARVFGRTIDQVRTFTNKPVLLSDAAVAPGRGQLARILNLFQGMRRYRTLGLVWFDQTTQGSGTSHEDWRLEDSAPARAAFRRAVSGARLVSPRTAPMGQLAPRLAADSVAQVQHPVALDDCVRVLEQMLGIDRPEVPLA